MPRNKGYHLESVFTKAIPYVSVMGYHASNLNTLIVKTNFNRRAFYAEFGNKLGFFEALLTYYINSELLPLQLTLRDNLNPLKESLHKYFKAYASVLNAKPCLLIRLLEDLSTQSESIQSQARAFYDQLTQSFIAAIERSEAKGQVADSVNIESQALKLTFLTQNYAIACNLPQATDDIHLLIDSIIAELS